MTPLRMLLRKSAVIGTNRNRIESSAPPKQKPVKHKDRQALVTHWQSEMTSQEMASLRPECVKSAPSQNLLEPQAAKDLAKKHLFAQTTLKRELHVAGMLPRRGIARVTIAEALVWRSGRYPAPVMPCASKLCAIPQLGHSLGALIGL